jgi:hypothetical protein
MVREPNTNTAARMDSRMMTDMFYHSIEIRAMLRSFTVTPTERKIRWQKLLRHLTGMILVDRQLSCVAVDIVQLILDEFSCQQRMCICSGLLNKDISSLSEQHLEEAERCCGDSWRTSTNSL